MIKIITRGSIKLKREIYLARCENCNCEFELDKSDTFLDEREEHFYGSTRKVVVGVVDCPCCGKIGRINFSEEKPIREENITRVFHGDGEYNDIPEGNE